MKTKICRGPKHPEGVELTIDNFYFRISKKTSAKYYHGQCKKCEYLRIRAWAITNIEKHRAYSRKSARIYYHERGGAEKAKIYNQSKAGIATRVKAQNVYRIKHRVKLKDNMKKRRNSLDENYIKNALVYGLGIPRDNISKDIIDTKRNQLILYREIKKQKSCKQ